MQNLKIKTEDLLNIVKQNYAKHMSDYETANLRFKEDYAKELTIRIGKLKNDPDFDYPSHSELTRPREYGESYRNLITRLEHTCDNEIEMTAQEWDCYVCDKWSWKDVFTNTNKLYGLK